MTQIESSNLSYSTFDKIYEEFKLTR